MVDPALQIEKQGADPITQLCKQRVWNETHEV